MAKRYLGGGISFEQKDVYQEFSEDEGGGGGGGSTTLAGLTDVDITDPTDGQTLVYNSTTEKWENGSGGGKTVYDFTYDNGDLLGSVTAADLYAAYVSGPVAIRYVYDDDGTDVTSIVDIIHAESSGGEFKFAGYISNIESIVSNYMPGSDTVELQIFN